MPRAHLFDVVRTIREDPANLNSADAEFIVSAEDSMDYVVKTTRKQPGIPASEWICHQLADACRIATPQYAQIELQDGRIGFGSQWDSSATTDQVTRTRIAMAIPGLPGLAAQFSAIYVLDLFVHNVDRHLGNYFFVKTRQGYGVKAFDFSQALFYHGWQIPGLPLNHCNTLSCYRSLRVSYQYDKQAGAELIRCLRRLPLVQLRQWLDEMPPAWLSATRKARFTDWWDNEAGQRLLLIERGLSNGTYL